MVPTNGIRAFALLVSASIVHGQLSLELDIPSTAPDNAIQVPNDFIGFGIESAFFDTFINDFSDNLVDVIASRMNAPPVIRVGGTGGDRFIIDFNFDGVKECDEEASLEDGACDDEPSHLAVFRIGKKFFESYKKGFSMARYMVQAPLDNKPNITQSRTFVREVYNNIETDRVVSIALGNEPGFYNHRDTTVNEYVEAAIRAQDAILEDLNLSEEDSRVFGIGETASEAKRGEIPSFGVVDILQTLPPQNRHISSAAEHYYQYHGSNHTLHMQSWLNPSSISSRLLSNYSAAITAAHARNLTYTISEDAATLSSPSVSDGGSFAFALWALEFNLACMVQGVDRVINLAGRPSAKRSFWTPDNSSIRNPGPRVGAPFAAAVAIADFLRVPEGSSPLSVARIGDENMMASHLSAYAAYDSADSGALKKLALLNLNVWRPSAGERGVATFDLRLRKSGAPGDQHQPPPKTAATWQEDATLLTLLANGSDDGASPTPQRSTPTGKTATLRRLHAPLGVDALGYDYCQLHALGPECSGDGGGSGSLAAEHNVTWAGQQWTWSVDQGKGHRELVEEVVEVRVVDGWEVVRVRVGESEGVVVFV